MEYIERKRIETKNKINRHQFVDEYNLIIEEKKHIEVVYITTIFGYNVYMENSLYFAPSRYTKNRLLWVEIDAQTFDLFSITNPEKWMSELGREIRKRFTITNGFLIRKCTKSDIGIIFNSIPYNIDYEYSIVVEGCSGLPIAYIILSTRNVTEVFSSLDKKWEKVLNREIIAYNVKNQEILNIIKDAYSGLYTSLPNRYLTIWYQYRNDTDKEKTANELCLKDSKCGFLFYQF